MQADAATPGLPQEMSGWRTDPANASAGASWLAGSSENSHLFHTHNASASIDSNLFRTPAALPQRASPTATTQRRGPPHAGLHPEAWQRGAATASPSDLGPAVARAASPPPRARTATPPRLPGDCPAAAIARQASASAAEFSASGARRAASPSPPPRPLTLRAIDQAETDVLPMAARFVDGTERRAAFQARIAELKGVIGASLQSLDEEEAADARRLHPASREAALAEQVLGRGRLG